MGRVVDPAGEGKLWHSAGFGAFAFEAVVGFRGFSKGCVLGQIAYTAHCSRENDGQTCE
ncbi:MAG: hypothetical protein JWL66_2027 [Sphingomonadales bacterium]|jgi:hypothetical protein|nr:hypothetical protein [Sphingomonadales bacterium]